MLSAVKIDENFLNENSDWGAAVKETAKKTAKKSATPTAEAVDYSAMTVAELKAVAKEKGITGISAMKKADLIAAIQNN